ncbi:hypothetical protein CBL_01822 [Carabus blaptoides fortunei]
MHRITGILFSETLTISLARDTADDFTSSIQLQKSIRGNKWISAFIVHTGSSASDFAIRIVNDPVFTARGGGVHSYLQVSTDGHAHGRTDGCCVQPAHCTAEWLHSRGHLLR